MPDRSSAAPASLEQTAEFLETPEAGFRAAGLEQQAERLDTWLKHQRGVQAEKLRKQTADLGPKLEKRLAKLEEAMNGKGRRRRVKPPAIVALDAFARLASEMQLLDATNLHDFRKGAKKARYVAELAAQGDVHAGEVGRTLKRLQDEIGDWHDWLVLANEARAALGNKGADLTVLIEAERERHYVAAMKMAAKLRGRLMGEWLASAQRRSAKKRSAEELSAKKRSAKKLPAKKLSAKELSAKKLSAKKLSATQV